jgi:hypothetical protein
MRQLAVGECRADTARDGDEHGDIILKGIGRPLSG